MSLSFHFFPHSFSFSFFFLSLLSSFLSFLCSLALAGRGQSTSGKNIRSIDGKRGSIRLTLNGTCDVTICNFCIVYIDFVYIFYRGLIVRGLVLPLRSHRWNRLNVPIFLLFDLISGSTSSLFKLSVFHFIRAYLMTIIKHANICPLIWEYMEYMENVSSINRLTTNRTTRPIKDKIKIRQTSGQMLAHVWRSLRIVFVFFFLSLFFPTFFRTDRFILFLQLCCTVLIAEAQVTRARSSKDKTGNPRETNTESPLYHKQIRLD